MNQLIWFSIPGAIVIFPLVIIFGSQLNSNLATGIAIISVPVIGFIIHQCWRTIYEICGGWSSKRRKVITTILGQKWGIEERGTAFLIWEMTFYDDKKVSDSFREHNRNSWHYIMSFQSCSFASFLSIIITSIHLIARSSCAHFLEWYWIIIFFLMGLLFFVKGKLTGKSINAQEDALFKLNYSCFEKTASAISPKNKD